VPHEVVAGLLVRDGRTLLCHRSPNRKWYPDVWDLPGGHVEEVETPEAALVRELHEELDIRCSPPFGDPVARLQDAVELNLTIYVVRDWDGTPINGDLEEHDEIGWFEEARVRDLRMAHPALRTIIETVLRSD
jgi:8-oxo-dGTP diphosphatase